MSDCHLDDEATLEELSRLVKNTATFGRPKEKSNFLKVSFAPTLTPALFRANAACIWESILYPRVT